MSNHTLEHSPNAAINKVGLPHYLTLPIPEGKILVTYVWFHQWIEGKTRTLDFLPSTVKEVPVWESGLVNILPNARYAQMTLNPVAIFKDPFLRGNNILVLCDGYKDNNTPTESNKRSTCAEVFEKTKGSKPWFGVEQQFTLLDMDRRPLGWPTNGYPDSQIRYSGVGAGFVCGRDIVDAHYRACLYAGVKIAGSNPQVLLSQWEYRIGICEGISVGDHLWMSRYILTRVAEGFGVIVGFDPKPVEGKWAGSGVHMNFSTEAMREDGGMVEINNAIDKLRKVHLRHMAVYDPKGGKDDRRLTGDPFHFHEFSSGIGDRHASIRIPSHCAEAKKGFLEDRRPSSNSDPYSVIEAILRTTLLNE